MFNFMVLIIVFLGIEILSRKEIKDALSYLQLVCNGEDLVRTNN
ncbi:MAG: hypothetical protein ACLRQF_13635 [Thomasclavelia ramosa]